MRRLLLALLVVLAGCATTLPATDQPDATTPPAAGGSVDAPASATPKDDAVQAEVVEIVDGDTMKVVLENGSRETVRLLGVDTPEVHGENTPGEFEGIPDTEAGRTCLRKWGEQASSVAKERLLGEPVTLSFDANEPRRGYYDRLLVYIHVDGDSFNYALITHGLARVYDSAFQYGDRYDAAESAAMEAGTGLWACRAGGAGSTPTDTATATIAEGDIPLRVSEIHADAEGDDRENRNDEYVVLKNIGDEELELSGWTVSDEADHTYTVPDGTSLAPGETLTLHTGSGTDGDGHLYWGAGSPVWNNAGDTVTVRTASGEIAAERSYS
ncbi:MAG: lamin tail domain-containing protein [Halolamina sp.]